MIRERHQQGNEQQAAKSQNPSQDPTGRSQGTSQENAARPGMQVRLLQKPFSNWTDSSSDVNFFELYGNQGKFH